MVPGYARGLPRVHRAQCSYLRLYRTEEPIGRDYETVALVLPEN